MFAADITMKLNKNFQLAYEEDGIYLQKKNEDGLWSNYCVINDTAAEALDGIAHGLEKNFIIMSMKDNYQGVDPVIVGADFDSLVEQLTSMGILED